MNLYSLLIPIGVIIVFAIVMISFRKVLRLFFTRILHGRYSLEFFQLYKKYFIRSPFQYCFRDEFVTHLLFVLDKHKNAPTFKSMKEIYFENTPYFTTFQEFLKKRGDPDCFNAFRFRNPDFIIKALGYHDNISGSKATLVFYFMDEIFFMGEYIFKNPRTKIKQSLVNHFLDDRTLEADNFYIENTRKRTVHYQDTGFTVDIKYITEENPSIRENLQLYLSQVRGKKLVQEI